MRHKKYILSISVQAPTNGAGNSLDILVANQHNFHCLSSITNLTIQDAEKLHKVEDVNDCLLYTSPSPRDATLSRMPSSA